MAPLYAALADRRFLGGFIMDSNDKVFGVLAYIGILFLVPLLAGKTEFTRFHANQGLVLFLAELVLSVAGTVLSFIPFVGFVGVIITSLIGVVSLVFMIIGIVNAAQGQMKELPVIGSIKLIK